MPLVNSSSASALRGNIATEVRAGRPQAQAVAIALSTGRRAWRRLHPTGSFPHHLRRTGAHRASRSNRAGPKKLVCRCGAYEFPHMPGGGACSTNRAGDDGDDGDYVLVYGGSSGKGFAVSNPFALKKMAIDEARSLSRQGSYGGEVRVGHRVGGRVVEVGRARDGQFHAAGSSVASRHEANRTGSLNMVKWSHAKKVITLGRKDTKLWEDRGPDGYEFRQRVTEMAREQAERSGHSVEIYASASEGGWMADQILPER